MSFTTSTVAGGTTGALPDAPVAIDSIGGALYQRTKLAHPNADQTGAYAIDTDPMRVRQRRRGTADYDSGNIDVPAGAPAAVTGGTVYLLGAYLLNITDQMQPVQITDTAGKYLFKGSLQPGEVRSLPVNDEVTFVGIKAGADNASAVQARFWGTQ